MAGLALVLLGPLACAELNLSEIAGVILQSGALDEATVADGLRQALTVGTERAVTTRSEPGGFAADPVLRLELPRELEPLASTAKTMGLGYLVDSLEDGMNRAAEAAAAEAVPVFEDAVRAMTISDAFEILRGADDAATRYFEEKTSASLRERFSPVVAGAMEKVGLYQQYRSLLDRYHALPFAKPMPPSLEDYITDRTLDGLFQTLAAEEARIRQDPAARTSQLLRRVFGSSEATPAAAP